MVRVNGMSNNRAMPTTKNMGRKTTTVVTVEAKIGMAKNSERASASQRFRSWLMALNILQFDDRIIDEPVK